METENNKGENKRKIKGYKIDLSKVQFTRKLEVENYKKVSDKNGKTYSNASVRITDLAGQVESKRIGTFLFGVNFNKTVIDNGDYVSEDEVKEAIKKEINLDNKDEQEVHFVDKSGNKKNINEILESVSRASGRIVAGERNEKIKNQNGINWGVEAKETGIYKNKGVAFLGNSRSCFT